MKSRSTNLTRSFGIAFGIAFAFIALTVFYFAFKNSNLDIRSRAALVYSYKCTTEDNCNGDAVDNVYCGTCRNFWVCCKTATYVAPTRTPTPYNKPTPTPTSSCIQDGQCKPFYKKCCSGKEYEYRMCQSGLKCGTDFYCVPSGKCKLPLRSCCSGITIGVPRTVCVNGLLCK